MKNSIEKKNLFSLIFLLITNTLLFSLVFVTTYNLIIHRFKLVKEVLLTGKIIHNV